MKYSIFYFLLSRFCVILLFSIFYFLLSGSARAAVLYIEPVQGEYYQGDTFVVSLRIDTEKECINTVEANLGFPQDILEAVDFSSGDSILTFWVSPPIIDQLAGLISFSGGIPGGYCGRLPGDPGESNLLGRIIFQVKAVREQFSDTATVKFLDTSQVLLNDGLGTPADLVVKGAVFTVLPGVPETPKQEWQEEMVQDNIPPEVFEISINQGLSIFDGKYFIIFSTTDKQTGLDYYEVKEGDRDWQRTTGPHLLNDQSLRSIIKVRAVDKAGNERIAEYNPTGKLSLQWLLTILVAMAVIWLAVRKLKKTPKKSLRDLTGQENAKL